jgi:hypothetical protein
LAGSRFATGGFYGDSNDQLVRLVRKRRFPMIGDGEGMTSWIHLDDAAAATVLAIEHDGPAIYNIVDDEPAPAREWLPVLAQALGAKPPHHIPAWLVRIVAGQDAVLGPHSPGVPPTRKPSGSWGGTCATPAGGRASGPSTPTSQVTPRSVLGRGPAGTLWRDATESKAVAPRPLVAPTPKTVVAVWLIRLIGCLANGRTAGVD